MGGSYRDEVRKVIAIAGSTTTMTNAEKGQRRERKIKDKERERERERGRERKSRDIAARLKNVLTDNEIHFPRSIKGKRGNLDFSTLLRLD